MNTSTWIEIVGYVGSFLVLVSFLMASVFKLRIVNTIGSFIFMIYALIIKSYPTAIMNFCLVLINLHFLWKMSKDHKEYELIKVKKDDGFLKYVLGAYDADIRKCFPNIEVDPEKADEAYILCCQNKPAGVFLGKGSKEKIDIMLDYSTPEYRDFSLGKFLMSELKKSGVGKLVYSGPAQHHAEYLEKTGFTKTEEGYVKVLNK